jgi:hypothetical protein
MKHVAKWLFFCTRHVGPLVDTRVPIVMSGAKKTLILQLVASIAIVLRQFFGAVYIHMLDYVEEVDKTIW